MGYTDSLRADAVLTDLVSVLRSTLEDDLVGVYLYGSLATGDFVEGRSDVDLLILLEQRVDQRTLSSLTDLHRRFDAEHESWPLRIDIAYVGRAALMTFQSEPYEVIVSDDEHTLTTVDAPPYYLIDWFKVQEHGTVLFGPDIGSVMPPLSVADFTQAVYDYMDDLPRIAEDATRPGEQAYVALTICRSLYAYEHATHTSKRSGAAWAMTRYPQWRDLIQESLSWNRTEETDDAPDEHRHRAIIDFVNFMLGQATK